MDQATTLLDIKSGVTRDYTFDYSFWSHDGFIDINGVLEPADDHYADQRKVSSVLSKEILKNALEGYNCCLFAYGQTGSGKSYSMMGHGNNKGIIPISSQLLFKWVEETQGESVSYEILFSMLEIYNERIQDLLVPVSQRPHDGLRVRESKVSGVFVENLSKRTVCSYEELEALMDLANTNRSIAATQMSIVSSRAHTILTIELKQIEIDGDSTSEQLSVITLVDLAGSEKLKQTGATGDRLKESNNINKSLVVLCSVIEALAERSKGTNRNIVIPYRDSALTRILSNSLGGNSKTVMMCTLSPASVDYEETLSTLRYADRVKKIQSKAVVNAIVQGGRGRGFEEEKKEMKVIGKERGLEYVMEIKDQISKNCEEEIKKAILWQSPRTSNQLSPIDTHSFKLSNESAKNIRDPTTSMPYTSLATSSSITTSYSVFQPEPQEVTLGKKKKLLKKLIKEFPFIAKEHMLTTDLASEVLHGDAFKVDISGPHITNISEDYFLSRRIFYNFEKLPLTVGRRNANPPNDLELSCSFVSVTHCVFDRNEEGRIFLRAVDEKSSRFLFVNGDAVIGRKVLGHLDRIIIGTTPFLFKIPGEQSSIQEAEIDFKYIFIDLNR